MKPLWLPVNRMTAKERRRRKLLRAVKIALPYAFLALVAVLIARMALDMAVSLPAVIEQASDMI